MKKTFKLLVSTVTAIAIMAASAISTFAAGTGTIKISNATPGQKYSVYKIFDAETFGTSVNYKVDPDMDTNVVDALLASDGPFKKDDSGYVVRKDDTVTDAKVIEHVKKVVEDNIDDLTPVYKDEEADATGKLDLSVDYGYYYVTSTLGSAVTISSITDTVTIIDKNDMPTWNPEEPFDPDNPGTPNPSGSVETGKFVYDTAAEAYAKSSNSAINQVEDFMICAHCPAYAGANKVVKYFFTDTLSAGFTYEGNAALYSVNDDNSLTEITTGFTAVPTTNTNGTTTVVFTYVVPADYEGAELVIKYKASADENAKTENPNEVLMDWAYIPFGDPDTKYDDNPETTDKPDYPATTDDGYPTTPTDPTDTSYDPSKPAKPGKSETTTYVYSFGILKFDAEDADKKPLDGAQFELYSAKEDGTIGDLIKIVPDGADYDYRIADTQGDASTTGVKIEAGEVTVFGLDKELTYFLVETKAPDDYNPVKDPIKVTLSGVATDDVVEVANSKGSTLPSTGGMGTTIFIVVGSVLMAGGFIAFVSKKRMSLKEEEK